MKYKNRLKVLAVVAILIFSFIATPAIAEEKKESDSAGIEYLTGRIHRIAGNEIVIDDKLYRFSSDIQFLSRQGANIEIRWFKAGDKIKFVRTGSDGVKILKKL